MTYEELRAASLEEGGVCAGFRLWAIDREQGRELDVWEDGEPVVEQMPIEQAMRLRDALLELFPLEAKP